MRKKTLEAYKQAYLVPTKQPKGGLSEQGNTGEGGLHRAQARAESTGRKFSEYCREILLNDEVVVVPKMTDNEREAIAILQRTGMFYGQISNLIKVKDKAWVSITKNLSICAKEAFKRFYNPHFRIDDDIYKVLNLTRNDRKV